MLATNPHRPGKHQFARRTRPVIGTDPTGAVRIHANNVAEAAALVGVCRTAVWFALRHPWKCAGLTWTYTTRFPRKPSQPKQPHVQRVRFLPDEVPAVASVIDGDTPAAFERRRYEMARRYNPTLTWAEFIAPEKNGRKPAKRGGQ